MQRSRWMPSSPSPTALISCWRPFIYVPSVTPAQRREGKLTFPKPIRLRRPGKSREGAAQPHANIVQLATKEKNGPFSPKFGEGFGMELSNSDQPHSAA